MEMQMCARCHKRIAVVFITRIDHNETIQEGLCLKCAQELGIKPVNDMLSKMGITEEDINNLSAEMQNAMGDENLPDVPPDDGEDGGAPAIELPKIFQNLGAAMQNMQGRKNGKKRPDGKEQKDNRKYLNTYCQNLTKKAAEGKIDRIIGRDKELERVTQILCRRQKNNPCLIGEPGVGKTAIAEALALRIADGQVPFKLQNREVWLVDLTALVAGTQFRGQFESRILGLINEVKASGNVILVIDEVHNIVGAGDADGSMNAANILKPALSRGEIQVIGATTLKEYRKYIEKDSALERRFQPVLVNEPSVEDTVRMLGAIKQFYEKFHGLSIPDATVKAAAVLSERYITDRFLPDKAIDLLDEAAAHVALHNPVLNRKLQLEQEMKNLLDEKTKTESEAEKLEGDAATPYYEKLAALKTKEANLVDESAKVEQECASVEVTVSDLADVIEIWTGIPASDVSQSEFERLDNLGDRIRKRIVGQDEAVDAVVRAVKRKRAGVSQRTSPVSMIFAGPTGVGKTELVKVLADDLFKQPDTLIRLDMSEYMEKHSVSRIIGAPPGYVGYDEAGQLTEQIRRRPYSVILFDEIEKAHPDVLNILLQILDDGHITDASGRKVNFENTIIIMTTNAGSDRSSAVSGFAASAAAQDKAQTERALLSFLRPEFLNRIDEVITFRHLTPEDFRALAAMMLGQLRDHLKEKGIALTYDDAAVQKIATDSYSEKFGARNMRRYIEIHVEDQLAQAVISAPGGSLTGAHLSVKDDQISLECL